MGNEVIRSHLIQEHLNKWKISSGAPVQHPNESLPSKTKELQALSGQKLKVTVGLLIGHTTLMFQLGLAVRQDCRLCMDENEDSLHIFMSLSGTGMQKIQNFGLYVLDAQGSRKHEGE